MEVPVQRDEVVIERQAPTGEPTSAPDIAPGEEISVPVSEEQVTVEKHPAVKEEVAVGKRAIQNTKQAIQNTKQVGGKVRNTTLSVEPRFN